MSGTQIRDALLSARTRRFREVDIPGLGTVKIQSMSERERADAQRLSEDKPGEFSARLIVTCVCNGDGHRLFSEADIPLLLEADSRVVQSLIGEILEHVQPFDTGKKDEDAAKNSSETGVGSVP